MTVKCPFCDEELQPSAKKCRICGEWLDMQTAQSKAPRRAAAPARPGASNLLATAGIVVVVVALAVWLFVGGPLSCMLGNLDVRWESTGFLGLSRQAVLRVSNPMGFALRNMRYAVSFGSASGKPQVAATTIMIPCLLPYSHKDVVLPAVPQGYDHYEFHLVF